MMNNYEKKNLGPGVFVRHLTRLRIRFSYQSFCFSVISFAVWSCVQFFWFFFFYVQSGPDYRSEESRRIHCTKCGNSHIWVCTNRTKAKARWCQVMNPTNSVILKASDISKLSLKSSNLLNVGLWSIPSSERWRWMGRTQRDITLRESS